MTYRELQKQLKTLRENGKDVKVRLNSKKVILEKELARLHELEETNSVGKEEVLSLQERSDLAESFVNKFSTKGERIPARASIKGVNKLFSGGVREYVKTGVMATSDGNEWSKGTGDTLVVNTPEDYLDLNAYPSLKIEMVFKKIRASGILKGG